jgi:hypothetical protein
MLLGFNRVNEDFLLKDAFDRYKNAPDMKYFITYFAPV